MSKTRKALPKPNFKKGKSATPHKPKKSKRLSYESEYWRTIRREVAERDLYKCQSPYCKDTLPYSLKGKYYEIDHIIPISKGGTNKKTNLRVLCERCHALRADKSHEYMRQNLIAQGRLSVNCYRYLWEG